MSSSFRFDESPFPSNELVYLHWLQSPVYLPESKRWILPVSFRQASGVPKQVDYPWGSLPALRIGQAFLKGSPQNHFSGKTFSVTLTSGAKVETAAQAVRLSHYKLFTRGNLAEICFSFSTAEGYTLIVPTVEVARACFAHNRALTEALLRPQAFRLFVHSYEAVGEELHLRLAHRARRHLKSRAFILQLARLLYLPSFHAAWQSVSHHLSLWQHPWTSEMLPPLSPSWRVRGVLHERSLLVLEIKSITSAEVLPFSLIRYGLTGENLRPLVLSGDESKVVKVPASGKAVISTEDRGTSRSKPVRALRTLSPALEPPGDVQVKIDISESEPRYTPFYIKEVADEEEKVGLTRESRDGDLTPGEFESRPKGSLEETAESEVNKPKVLDLESLAVDARFAEFASNIDALQDQLQKEILLLQSDLAINKKRSLTVVIAALTDPRPLTAYIIEVEATSHRSTSTLLMALSKPASLSTPTSVLTKAVSPRGHWQLQVLETIKASNPHIAEIFRLMHVPSSPESWAERVLSKLRGVEPKGVDPAGDGLVNSKEQVNSKFLSSTST